MKCPFCQQELRDVGCGLTCLNCKKDGLNGDPDFWKELNTNRIVYQTAMDTLVEMTEELTKTKQALDVAVDALKGIDKIRCVPRNSITTLIGEKIFYAGNVVCIVTPDQIHNALHQIKQITETKGGDNE